MSKRIRISGSACNMIGGLKEVMAGLDRMQEVLEKGSVAEVKAALRAYIGRIEDDPESNKAGVGFYKMPARAAMSKAAPESARISMVAGAGFDTDSSSSLDWINVSPRHPVAVPA